MTATTWEKQKMKIDSISSNKVARYVLFVVLCAIAYNIVPVPSQSTPNAKSALNTWANGLSPRIAELGFNVSSRQAACPDDENGQYGQNKIYPVCSVQGKRLLIEKGNAVNRIPEVLTFHCDNIVALGVLLFVFLAIRLLVFEFSLSPRLFVSFAASAFLGGCLFAIGFIARNFLFGLYVASHAVEDLHFWDGVSRAILPLLLCCGWETGTCIARFFRSTTRHGGNIADNKINKLVVFLLAIVVPTRLSTQTDAPNANKTEINCKLSINKISPKTNTRNKFDFVDKQAAPRKFWEVDAAHTNGFTEMQMRKWRKEHMPPPGYTNNAVLTRPKPKYAIFNHKCENLIAAYLTLRPGDGMIGTPILGERFRKEFLKSLETPIVVTEDDSPEDAQLKRDMIATKIDLKARMDAGEDICKIINDTHREVQDLSRYKTMLQKEIRDAAKNPEMTMQDVDDLVEAANKMLEAKGIAPIALGPISRRLIQRRKGF